MWRVTFTVAAGETWIDGVPLHDDEGNVNWMIGGFIIAFIIVVNWTVLQVSVAVLLDNFVNETAREREQQHDEITEHIRMKDNMGNVLDPLLRFLADSSIDQDHLSMLLCDLFKAMCKDLQTPELSRTETTRAFCALKFEPKLHFSDVDFSTITQNGALCNVDDKLGPAEFENVMVRQVECYIRRKLQRCTSEAGSLAEFSQLVALKVRWYGSNMIAKQMI